MEIRGKDTYRIVCGDYISEELITSLFSLYQPMIGSVPVMLYMTMYSEGRKQKNQENHLRLCSLMNISVDDLERARIRLEEYGLLQVYVLEQESRNSYIYVLKKPVNGISA